MNYSGFDIIGDVHGHADKLVQLLRKLGYREQDSAYTHPDRQAIFVGDFVDRGPQQGETVRIARNMVLSGSAQAVMGNHEFNAIAWHTPDPERPGEFLRPRTGEKGRKNRNQHQQFLKEFEHLPQQHADQISWFKTLPLWLDLGDIRVVHACWHEEHMRTLAPGLAEGQRLTDELIVAASRKGSAAYEAVEVLTKGMEIPLPGGIYFRDKDQHPRKDIRIRWWDNSIKTYRDHAMLEDDIRATIPDLPLSADIAQLELPPCEKPTFFGHYWMAGRPQVLADTVACVDYSAGKGGPLVAYRWSGESILNNKNFVLSYDEI